MIWPVVRRRCVRRSGVARRSGGAGAESSRGRVGRARGWRSRTGIRRGVDSQPRPLAGQMSAAAGARGPQGGGAAVDQEHRPGRAGPSGGEQQAGGACGPVHVLDRAAREQVDKRRRPPTRLGGRCSARRGRRHPVDGHDGFRTPIRYLDAIIGDSPASNLIWDDHATRPHTPWDLRSRCAGVSLLPKWNRSGCSRQASARTGARSADRLVVASRHSEQCCPQDEIRPCRSPDLTPYRGPLPRWCGRGER